MAFIYDLADTWNDGGTTFTAIKMNVTDTDSASGSLLMDLQVGGTSKFSVRKGGIPVIPQSSAYAFAVSGGYSVGLYSLANYTASIAMSSVTPGAALSAYKGFEFELTGPTLSMGLTTLDVKITRDAANTLAQRNGAAAQTFNLYNTYTDASNYERGFMKWDSDVLKIGTGGLGTGAVTPRALELQTNGTTRVTISPTGLASFSGDLHLGGGSEIRWSASTILRTPSGNGTLRLSNSAANDFDRLQFGGTTSSFPALKRSTTSLQARLADDTDFTNIQGKLTTETAYTAGAPTATGYIVLYDSTGTAYKVPAEAL